MTVTETLNVLHVIENIAAGFNSLVRFVFTDLSGVETDMILSPSPQESIR